MPRPLLRVLSLLVLAAASATVSFAQTTLPSRTQVSGRGQTAPYGPRGWMPGMGAPGWAPWMWPGGPCGPTGRMRQVPLSPYDAAADEAATAPSAHSAGRGESAPSVTLTRPTVAERQWSTDPASPYFQAQEQAVPRAGIVRSAGTGYDADAFASRPSDDCGTWAPWMAFDPYGYGYWLDGARDQGSTMVSPGAAGRGHGGSGVIGRGVAGRGSARGGRGQSTRRGRQ